MIRQYRYEDLDDSDFEELANRICTKLLGIGTISFASGKDGGRDGKFSGTASEYPSASAPHSGKFIIQTKWTSNPAASCGDREFGRLMKKEFPKIEALHKNHEIDHYIVFTNRRKPAKSTLAIIDHFKGIGLSSVEIFGTEELDRLLEMNPAIWTSLGLSDNSQPFRVDPTDLSDVVVAFKDAIDDVQNTFSSATNFVHVKLAEKNKINNLTKEYATYLKNESMPYFSDIKAFLSDPRNAEIRDIYHDAADDLKQKIMVTRSQFTTFDKVLTYVHDAMTNQNQQLKRRKRFVRVFLHYMYHDCDIGQHA